MGDDIPQLSPDELRNRAEARLECANEAMPGDTPEEMQLLIHELRTHQIELEMQNEALRKTEDELLEARDRYSDLYNFSPIGYITLNQKLIITQANLTMASMLAMDLLQLTASRFSKFVCKEDQDIYYAFHRSVVTTQSRQVAELRLVKASGELFWAALEARHYRCGGCL